MSEINGHPPCQDDGRLRPVQAVAISFSVALGLVLAAYGAAGSYETIADLAARKGLPLPALVPIGLDGGLIGVIALDLVLTWTGQPLGWLRQLARLVTMATVAANAAAGYPDAIAVGLHSAAPVMLLAMLEAARAVLLRRMGIVAGTARDRIPLARWFLAPWRTWLMWRRMVLWQITSYHAAVEIERHVSHTLALLRARHGRHWKRHAPAEVVWRLGNGIAIEEARALVGRLTDTDTHEDGDGQQAGALRLVATGQPDVPRRTASLAAPELQKALLFNERHWAAYGRPASAEKLREHLGIGAARARALTRTIRERDRSAVCQAPILPTTAVAASNTSASSEP